MDKFPDGIHVRLRSRVRRASYLHADEDGVGVSLLPLGRQPTLNAVWRVHRVLRDSIDYVLLHGAAYGRYLALSPDEEEPAGHRGVPAIQRGYDSRDLDAVMWRPVAVAGSNSSGYLRMRHVYNGNLRANGRFRPWITCVTVDQYFGTTSTMRHWSVEVVPHRQGPPPALPLPTGQNPGGRSGLLRQRTKAEADRRRMIRYLRSDDPRDFEAAGLPAFPFYGRSVFNLRFQAGTRANPGDDVFNTIMCVKCGMYGRLTPLVTDLPRSDERMDIVVFTAGSPDVEQLVYPDVDAQGQ